MKRKDEVIVGIFVTVAVAIGVTGTLYLARRGFTKSYPMYARFDWGQNLKVGQPVYLAGVQVGYVRVGFSPNYGECPPASPIFSKARDNGLFKLGTPGTAVYEAFAPQPGDFD